MKKFLTITAALLFAAISLHAEDEAPAYADYDAFAASAEYGVFTVHNLWMMIAAGLVFIMHLGFATVESGLTQSKNTVNILFKNTFIPCIGLLTYALIGFNLMYPGDNWTVANWIGNISFGIGVGADAESEVASLTLAYGYPYTYWTDFLFQAMFAATAATIVSGAVAERIKLSSFMVFSLLYVAIAYPIAGSWKWGGGWLQQLETPFYDFAGSTIVHSIGGWGALTGAIILGPVWVNTCPAEKSARSRLTVFPWPPSVSSCCGWAGLDSTVAPSSRPIPSWFR